MSRLFLGFFCMLLLAAAFALLPLGNQAAAQTVPVNCRDDDDDDGDTVINDGCPQVNQGLANPGKTSEGVNRYECDETTGNAMDDDSDGGGTPPWPFTQFNDGCPAVGDPETIVAGCAINDQDDDDGDTFINDGCPAVGTPGEDRGQCANTLDDDGDTVINDGCGAGWPAAVGDGQREVPDSCANAMDDDDMDGYINDGCPVVPPVDESKLPVGGVADLPDVGGSSGANYALLAGGLAAAALALTAGGWYARRRLSRG